MKKWCFFAAAAVFGGYFLMAAGAPPLPVILGIGCSALITARSTRSA